MVVVSAHGSHLPLFADAIDVPMSAIHTEMRGMDGLLVGGTLAHANADVHTTDALGTSACCTDVVLSIPSRPALLAIAALLGAALVVAAPAAPGVWPTWSVPTLAPGRRRALLQVYLN